MCTFKWPVCLYHVCIYRYFLRYWNMMCDHFAKASKQIYQLAAVLWASSFDFFLYVADCWPGDALNSAPCSGTISFGANFVVVWPRICVGLSICQLLVDIIHSVLYDHRFIVDFDMPRQSNGATSLPSNLTYIILWLVAISTRLDCRDGRSFDRVIIFSLRSVLNGCRIDC